MMAWVRRPCGLGIQAALLDIIAYNLFQEAVAPVTAQLLAVSRGGIAISDQGHGVFRGVQQQQQ